MRHTPGRVAITAALLLFGMVSCKQAPAQTIGYAKNTDGSYSVTLTFADGTVLTFPATLKPVVTPPPAGGGGTETGPPPVVTPPTTTPPPPGSLPTLNIAAVYPNDDSFVIKVVPVAGAADYIAVNVANPSDIKASGGNVLLEWNGPAPQGIYVQALATLAPFSPHSMDGAMPGMLMVTNGQGSPLNPLRPLAQSAVIAAQYKPITPAPGASQFALFRSDAAAVPLARTGDKRASLGAVSADKRLTFRFWNADFANSDPFIAHTHFMEDLYDGGTPGTGLPPHVQNATTTMDFSPAFDFSGGKVLHASVEVDAHFDSRRWCEMWIVPASDAILNPENVEVMNNGGADWSHTMPTTTGNLLVWRWDAFHNLYQIRSSGGVKSVSPVLHTDWNDKAGFADRFTAANRAEVAYKPGQFLNGRPNVDLDLRHRFDLYLSDTRVVGYETDPEGVRVKIFDKALPASLGFTKARIVVTHKLYHSSLELQELKQYAPAETHWIANTPYSETRHWDSLYGEVLGAFPP